MWTGVHIYFRTYSSSAQSSHLRSLAIVNRVVTIDPVSQTVASRQVVPGGNVYKTLTLRLIKRTRTPEKKRDPACACAPRARTRLEGVLRIEYTADTRRRRHRNAVRAAKISSRS